MSKVVIIGLARKTATKTTSQRGKGNTELKENPVGRQHMLWKDKQATAISKSTF